MAKRRRERAAQSIRPRRLPDYWKQLAAVAALAIAVYANSIPNGFVGDDKYQLLRNPLITDPALMPQVFTTGVWSFLKIPGNYYRPVQFLVYLLIYQFAGFQAPVFHFLMTLGHAVNTVLVYLLVRRLSPPKIAMAAAALFAVHPIHTEAVSWIACVPELLMTTLMLLGVWIFLRQDTNPRGGQIAGHCAIWLAALLTKETSVTLLPLYFAAGALFGGRGWSELRTNARLYAAMTGAFIVYLVLRVHALGALAPGQHQFVRLGPAEFLLSAVAIAGGYMRMLVLPIDLNYFHVFHPTRSITAVTAVSALALGALAVAFFRLPWPSIRYCLFWIAVTMAPVFNLTGVGQNVVAERYLYLPSVGFCWIAGMAWNWLSARRAQMAAVLGIFVLLLCALQTISRNRDWRDTLTMLQLTVRQSPDAASMHDALASEYVERNAFDQALVHQRLAVQYEPERSLFRFKLGHLLLLKDPGAAAAEFERAAALEPEASGPRCGLALAFEATGRPEEAAEQYRRVLRQDPQNKDALEGLQRLQRK